MYVRVTINYRVDKKHQVGEKSPHNKQTVEKNGERVLVQSGFIKLVLVH